MTRIESYRDLLVWQRAFALGMAVHRATAAFPEDERWGLTSQLRRGSVAIRSNVAEGFGRGSRRDYLRFLRVARGALFEMETQLFFALEFGYLAPSSHRSLMDQARETGRLLAGLIRSLEGGTSGRSKPSSSTESESPMPDP